MSRKYEGTHNSVEPSAQSEQISEQSIHSARAALRFFRYLLLCVLVLVLAITVILNRDNINMDSLRRLFAKIDIGVSATGEQDGTQISLPFEEDVRVASFKDGLAHLTPSELTVLDNQGTVFMSAPTGFGCPELLTGDRYIVCYDRGGTKLLVTNSFAVVFEQTMPENIAYVTMSDQNYLAVITTGGGYKNSLYVYNASFEQVFVWHSNERYLLSADVSPDKKTVALTCYNVKDGGNTPELVGIHLDEEQIAWNTELGSLPLALRYKSAGNIALLYSDRLEFYSGKGKAGRSYVFEKNYLQAFSFTGDHTVLLLSGSKRGDSTLYSINDRGKESALFEVGAHIIDMDVRSGKVALLSEEGKQVYSLASKRVTYREQTQAGVQSICFAGKNCLLDIFSTYCVYNKI